MPSESSSVSEEKNDQSAKEQIGTVDPDDVESGMQEGDTNDIIFMYWNGKQVAQSLVFLFRNDPNPGKKEIAAELTLDGRFVYNGKSLSDYETEAEAERIKAKKLAHLLKVGEALSCGEALYQTGTEDGEKWSRELYEETVAAIGEEIIAEYIADGVFLEEKLKIDLEAARTATAAQEKCNEAKRAYREEMVRNAVRELERLGIAYETMTDSGRLLLFVTEEDFAALSFEGIVNWMFRSAPQTQNGEYSQDMEVPTDDAEKN